MTVLELLSDGRRWTIFALARDENYMRVLPQDKYACSWCLLGAIQRVYPNIIDQIEVIDKLISIIHTDITTFNDLHSTSHEDIIRVLEEAQI